MLGDVTDVTDSLLMMMMMIIELCLNHKRGGGAKTECLFLFMLHIFYAAPKHGAVSQAFSV